MGLASRAGLVRANQAIAQACRGLVTNTMAFGTLHFSALEIVAFAPFAIVRNEPLIVPDCQAGRFMMP